MINSVMYNKIQPFANKSHGKLFGIKYQERNTNEYVKHKIISIIDNYEPIRHKIKRR